MLQPICALISEGKPIVTKIGPDYGCLKISRWEGIPVLHILNLGNRHSMVRDNLPKIVFFHGLTPVNYNVAQINKQPFSFVDQWRVLHFLCYIIVKSIPALALIMSTALLQLC